MKRKVEFVSYTGKYPNLCWGILTVNIDGVEVKFGDSYHTEFWNSGGCVGCNSDWDMWEEKGKWELNEDIEDEFKDIENELIEVFNNNVPYGCCGGCI